MVGYSGRARKRRACREPVVTRVRRFPMCSPTVIESALASVSRREAVGLAVGLFACALTGASPRAAAGRRAEKRTIAADNVLDLTHVLSPAFPIWPGGAPIKVTNTATLAKEGYFAN